jgi:hypothetical protein
MKDFTECVRLNTGDPLLSSGAAALWVGENACARASQESTQGIQFAPHSQWPFR